MSMAVGNWHDSMIRVRFEETDFMGVVYYGKFFTWLEVGRVNLLRHLGVDIRDWAERGLHIPVVQAHADYKAPAHFDEEIMVRTRIAKVGSSSIRFENEVYRVPERKLLCVGHTVHVLTNREGRPTPFPDDLRKKFTSS